MVLSKLANIILNRSSSYQAALRRIGELEHANARLEEEKRSGTPAIEFFKGYKYAFPAEEVCHVLSITFGMHERLHEHLPSIRNNLERMGDESSAAAYRNELANVMLMTNPGRDIADACGFTMPWDVYNKRMAEINPADFPDVYYPPEWKFPPQMAGFNFVYPQYTYDNIITLREGDVFFDCGACAGEVSIWASQKVGATGKVCAFEPHPSNFGVLQKNISAFAPSVSCYPLAVSDKPGKIIFSQDGTPSSQMAEGQGVEVDAISIDEFSTAQKIVPTLIKMDVEGAELLALQGARETITAHKPDLAICTYHKLEHLWEVGDIIRQFCPEYTFYFRAHHPVWERVLYATCKTKP